MQFRTAGRSGFPKIKSEFRSVLGILGIPVGFNNLAANWLKFLHCGRTADGGYAAGTEGGHQCNDVCVDCIGDDIVNEGGIANVCC